MQKKQYFKKIVSFFLTKIVGYICLIWMRTIRFRGHEKFIEEVKNCKKGNKTVIAGIWHNELFSLAALGVQYKLPLIVVLSQSKDGDMASGVLDILGLSYARGSSSRGGLKALLQMRKDMQKNNKLGVFTVDGPRGPRHEPKDGIFFLSQVSDGLILPVRARPKWKKIFSSWDKFVLPYPFTVCEIGFTGAQEVKEKSADEGFLVEKEIFKDKMKNAFEK